MRLRVIGGFCLRRAGLLAVPDVLKPGYDRRRRLGLWLLGP